MKFRLIAVPIFISIAIGLPATAMENSQNIAIDSKLRIPGGQIDPGTYVLTIEKRLTDRLLVRLSSGNTSNYHILLAVPSEGLTSGADSSKGIILFNTSDNKQVQILRGWLCPICTQGLEFVYPKGEAEKITVDTAQPTLAADPGALESAAVWTISTRYVARAHRGVDIKSVLLLHAITQVSTSKPAAKLKQLPKTATNTALLALWGLMLLVSGAIVRTLRQNEIRQ